MNNKDDLWIYLQDQITVADAWVRSLPSEMRAVFDSWNIADQIFVSQWAAALITGVLKNPPEAERQRALQLFGKIRGLLATVSFFNPRSSGWKRIH